MSGLLPSDTLRQTQHWVLLPYWLKQIELDVMELYGSSCVCMFADSAVNPTRSLYKYVLLKIKVFILR